MFALTSRRARSNPTFSAIVFAAFATLLGVVGVGTLAHALLLEHAMATDPVCGVALSVETFPRRGSVCAIEAGSVASAYTTYGSKGHRTHHVVVITRDARDSFALQDLSSPVYAGARAAIGEPAVVETVAGQPAFIVTASGTAAGQGDPQGSEGASAVLLVIAAVMGACAIGFWRMRPRPAL